MKLKKKSSPLTPFHLVKESYWPFISSLISFSLFSGMIVWFNESDPTLMFMSILMLLLMMFMWWSDIVVEASYLGLHTKIVQKGLSLGMILFIISECFFFLSFFWTYLHGSLSPSPLTGLSWPPVGIILPNPFKIPLLNTLILLSSGVTVTAAHYSLLVNKKMNFAKFMFFTLILALMFLSLQLYEYKMSSFSISDGFFGSIFFLGTGFHGLHVFIGTIFLLVMLLRKNQFTPNRHLGLEFASWYWHFVDIVWLILYILFYWWGSK